MTHLRTVRFRVPRGPVFTLSLQETGNYFFDGQPSLGARPILAYRFHMSEGGTSTLLQEGKDFRPSILHAIDSDQSMRDLMSFLVLQKGDTDPEFFENDSPEMAEYRERWAEDLAWLAAERWGE